MKICSELRRINGIGFVHSTGKEYKTVDVYGSFDYDRWSFIIHRDLDYDAFAVSETKSGYLLTKEIYATVEDAYYYATRICDQKRFYFSTRIGDILVARQTNLGYSNSNITTPAILSLCT